jgi:hypothetical protein
MVPKTAFLPWQSPRNLSGRAEAGLVKSASTMLLSCVGVKEIVLEFLRWLYCTYTYAPTWRLGVWSRLRDLEVIG